MWRRQPEAKPVSTGEVSPAATRFAAAETPAGGVEAGARAAATRISAGVTVRGEITGREDVYLDGKADGPIRLEGAGATIGPKGRVKGDIEAQRIEIHGKVRGTLTAKERLLIGRTGVVTGNVTTQRIAIEDGAVFQGSVNLPRPGEARAARHREAAATAAAGEPARVLPELTPVAQGSETPRVPVKSPDSVQ